MARIQILLGTQPLYDSLWLQRAPAPALRATLTGTGGEGWKWVVETVEPIRGQEVTLIPRDLARTDLRFTVATEYPDHASALLALFTGPLKLPRGGVVQIIAQPDAGPSQRFYLTQGQLESVGNPQILGCHIEQTYTLIGGQWTTKQPLS